MELVAEFVLLCVRHQGLEMLIGKKNIKAAARTGMLVCVQHGADDVFTPKQFCHARMGFHQFVDFSGLAVIPHFVGVKQCVNQTVSRHGFKVWLGVQGGEEDGLIVSYRYLQILFFG